MVNLGRNKICYSEGLTGLLMLSPIFDVINGWLMMNGYTSSVSATYKIFVLFYIVFPFKGRFDKKLVLFVWLLILASLVRVLFLQVDFNPNVNDYVKLLFPLMLLYVLKEMPSEGRNECIHRVLNFYSWFYPLSVLIPTFLGIGFHTYGTDSFGYKGFYYAGNELAGVMLIVLAYAIQNCFDIKSGKNLICLALMTITCVLIGMKSLYIGIAVLVLFYLKQLLTNRKTIFLFIPIVMLVLGAFFAVIRSDFISTFLQVQQTRFAYRISGQYQNETLAFLLSGRNDTVAKSFNGLWQYGGVLGVFCGLGIDEMTKIAGKITEMDFFDMFLWNGAIVTLWFFYLIWNGVLKEFHRLKKYEQLGVILMIAFSFLAGHVFYAPSVMIPIVLVCLDYPSEGMRKVDEVRK